MSVRTRLKRLLSLRGMAAFVAVGLAGIGLLYYGAQVEKKARTAAEMNAPDRFAHRIIQTLEVYPGLVWEVLTGEREMDVIPQRDLPPDYNKVIGRDTIPVPMTYLYALYDRGAEAYHIRHLDLASNRVLREWTLPFDTLKARHEPWRQRHQNKQHFSATISDLAQYTLHAPVLRPDGGLILNCQGMLLRIDKQAQIVWVHDKLFHHSLELDAEGKLWACSTEETGPGRRMYTRDQLVRLDPQTGETLFTITLDSLMRSNPPHDYTNLNREKADPYHLNEVQPVRSDGPFWQRGDVFLSLRNLNAVLLYRPATNRVLWSKLTEWYGQHDVNIVNDSVITVFNNNFFWDKRYADSLNERVNELVAYNFRSGETASWFKPVFERQNVNTKSEGRGRFFPADSMLHAESPNQNFEEECFGVIADLKRGRTYKFVLPGWTAGKAGHLGWFRLLPKEE